MERDELNKEDKNFRAVSNEEDKESVEVKVKKAHAEDPDISEDLVRDVTGTSEETDPDDIEVP